MPTTKPQRKMVDLDVDETSGVDWPAHLAPGWVVCKSATAQDVQALFGPDATEGTHTMATPEAQEKTPTVEDLAKQIEDMQKSLAAETARAEKAEAEKADLEKAAAAKDEVELTDEQKLLKELPAEMRERFEKMEADNKATEAKLQKAIDDRLDDQARTEAATMYKSVALDTDTVGPQLRRLALVDADLHKSVTEALKAADAQLTTAGIFQQAGRSDGATDSAKAQILAKAAELRAADPKLTEAGAFTKALNADPSLYTKYQAEEAGK